MQEIPTFFDEEKELLDIENAREEMAIQKEYEKIVKECEEQEKDFSFGSANHQEFIEEQNIKDIESTDFYKSDM